MRPGIVRPRRLGDLPMVRPPVNASGGGVAYSPFANNSGAPGMPPSENGQRAADEQVERFALARGLFAERILMFPQFKALAAGQEDTQYVEIKSNGESFVRLVAMRGTFTSNNAISGAELANLFVLLEISGQQDLTTSGKQSAPASFAILFAEDAAPWFWFAAPPLVRVSQTISATISCLNPPGVETELTPQLAFRTVDNSVWQSLYGS